MSTVQVIVNPQQNPSTAVPLGGAPGTNFQPEYILFYRLYADNTVPASWTFDYPVSGLYDSIDVTQFVSLVLADDLPDMSATPDDPLDPPSITVTDQCYVVIQLTSNDATMAFQAGVPAIKTASDCHLAYRRLVHVDADGNTYVGKTPAPGGALCNIVYFAVKSVKPDDDDPYDIFVQYGGTTAVVKVIDPAIKNRGGTTPLLQGAIQTAANASGRQRKKRQKARLQRMLARKSPGG